MRRLALLLAVVAGCRPAPGGRCGSESAICQGVHTALRCQSGHWQAFECGGPGGCVESAKDVRCDAAVAREGAACVPGREQACASDGRTLLRCEGAVWVSDTKCARCVVSNEVIECHSDS